MQAIIDSGCEPYQTEIDSISCEETNEMTECICFETRTEPNASPSVFKLEWPYDLDKIEGQWKIINMEKDHPEWEDEGMEL
jgi:hypothetical protein